MEFLVHAFLLHVFVNQEIKSRDMYFEDMDRCLYFAQRLARQGKTVTAYCLPRQVDPNITRIY